LIASRRVIVLLIAFLVLSAHDNRFFVPPKRTPGAPHPDFLRSFVGIATHDTVVNKKQNILERGWQNGRMTKKSSTRKKPARTTLASVKREMQTPRQTASVRDDPKYQAILAAEKSAGSK
jgi:hypothetical protein